MRNFQLGRRTFLGAGVGATALTLAACGTSGPGGSGGGSGGGGGGDSASIWQLSGQPNEYIYQDSIDAFNELDEGTLEVTFFQNDAYKQKIRTAIGAGEAPTIIYGWGGGGLRTYARESQVEDLTDWLAENSDFKDRFVDSVWNAATVDEKVYALPIGATQPIIMFNNKKVLEDLGAEAPETWDDLMTVVEKANSAGVSPISLAGQSRWTSMMWLEYLLGLAIPVQATIVPIYLIIIQMHMYDSLVALMLPGIAFGLPLSVLIISNAMRDVPKELFEAMDIDGCTEWQKMWRLAFPICQPAIVTVAVYQALMSWNGFLFPLILTQSPDKRTLPLALWNFQGEYATNVPVFMAAVILSSIPIIVLYAFGRRYLVSGMTAGSGK